MESMLICIQKGRGAVDTRNGKLIEKKRASINLMENCIRQWNSVIKKDPLREDSK